MEPTSSIEVPSFVEPPPILDLQPVLDRPPIIVEVPTIEESPPKMEVDQPRPPPVNSPLSTPANSTNSPPPSYTPDNGDKLLVVITSEQPQSALASLRRTLKKCNLKAIKPEIFPELSNFKSNTHGFKLNIPPSRFKLSCKNIYENWISMENSSIQAFFLDRQGKYFPANYLL